DRPEPVPIQSLFMKRHGRSAPGEGMRAASTRTLQRGPPMNRNRKSARPRPQARRVWSHKQALSALPYLTAVMHSVRDHQMEYRKHQLTADRLADKPGRPDRNA